MKKFNYKAKDENGKTVTGKVEAQSQEDAAKLLRDQKLIIINLSLENSILQDLQERLRGHVSFDDLTVFTRQFATMVTSGIPITEGLVILRSQAKPSLQPVLAQILADVEAGASLGDALAKHEDVFSPVYVALVRSGEEGGVLDEVLGKLADTMETQREFRGKVKGALIYPAVVIIGMIAVVIIMMIFVIPKMNEFYKQFNAPLPGPTQFLINVSSFVIHFWWLVIALIGLSAWFFINYAKSGAGIEKIDEIKLNFPVLGKLQRQMILTDMARTLGLLSAAGVPILDSLRVVSDVVGNRVVKRAIERAAGQIEKGFSVASAFSQDRDIFPPMLYQMLVVGEETGKLDESLLKVAKVFEQESNQAVKNLLDLVQPLVMVVLGVGVGFLAISVILPIYSLTSKF